MGKSVVARLVLKCRPHCISLIELFKSVCSFVYLTVELCLLESELPFQKKPVM
jgi:hypothetical protein